MILLTLNKVHEPATKIKTDADYSDTRRKSIFIVPYGRWYISDQIKVYRDNHAIFVSPGLDRASWMLKRILH